MSYQTATYDRAAPEGWPPDPVAVLVVEGTHDISRLVAALNHGTVEQMGVGSQLARQLRRHNTGQAALRLLRDHGGVDLTRQPPVTVLCGSARFGEAFRRANLDLTLAGHIVLSIGCDTKSDDVLGIDEPGLKDRLDELHFRKIEMADEVLVLNVGGYVGESTAREIAYATRLGRPVRYLEPESIARESTDA